MKKEILKKLPRIGQSIYMLKYIHFHVDISAEIVESMITAVIVSGAGKILIGIDLKADFFELDRNRMWFSRKKAKNVLAHLLKQRYSQLKKLQRENNKRKLLIDNQAQVEKDYIGKKVLVKVGDDDFREDVIKGIRPHVESNSYTLFFENITVRQNHYLLTKENKTWQFTTDDDILAREKYELEKQLIEINKKLDALSK